MSDYNEYHEREWDFPEEIEQKRDPYGTHRKTNTIEDGDDDYLERGTHETEAS